MTTKYYYVPTNGNGKTQLTPKDNLSDRSNDRVTLSRALDNSRPATPPLSRASTPDSSSGPPTPTLQAQQPVDPKMRRRQVGFASPITQAYRRAGWDELSVMRAFASHSTHCDSCGDPFRAHHRGTGLCERGTGLAKDLGTYFYCFDGKPHSTADRLRGKERVQVEIPGEYKAVKSLFEALDYGLDLRRPRRRPEVHQPAPQPVYTRPPPARRHTMDPSYSRRPVLSDDYYHDVKPSRTSPRRLKEPVYRRYDQPAYETRTPYDDAYNSKRTPALPRMVAAAPVSDRRRDDYHRDDYYYDGRREERLRDKTRRSSKRQSSYREDDGHKKRHSYMFPGLAFWR